MTILEGIQEAHEATGLDADRLSFASLQEFNSFTDSFRFADYPRNVVVPPRITGTLLNNRTKEILLIRGWFLTRISQDTNNFRRVSIEPTYIAPMRQLARKFVRKLADIDINDPEVVPISYTIDSEYQFLKDHLFGVSYTINLPIYSYVC